ncbi:MAG: carboxypeptidase regulatory-like domain-containing protein [Acidobacteriota bacterium]
MHLSRPRTARRLPRLLPFLFAALLLAAVATAPIVAQSDQTGGLDIVLLDVGEAPVADAVLLVTKLDGGYPKDAISDADGRARFGFLVPGSYVITVQAPGYRDQVISDVRVRATQFAGLTITLQAAESFTEELTVTAERPLISATTTELDFTLDAEATTQLPTARTATDLVKFTPGASNGAVWGGSGDQANSYQLDGVSVNQTGFGGDFLLPNVDWIEEFQVKGLGAGAEYGNFQGGLINIVTKSGSNEVRGGVRGNFENDDLRDSTLDTREVGFEDDDRWEINADIAGPLVADKLYYFASAQRVERNTNVVDEVGSLDANDVVFLDAQEEREETKLFGKLTWQATGADLFNAVVGWDEVETANRGLDSFTDVAAAETQDSPSVFYNANWSRVWSSQVFSEFKFSGYDGDDDRLPKNGDLPAVQQLDGDRALFRNAVTTRLRTPETLAFTASADYFFETGSLRHNLKIGGEYEDGSWREQRTRNGGFTWRPERGDGPFDADDPSTWGFISSDWGGDINLDAETLNAAVYVQDYIDITDRFRLSAGLRWGIWEGDLTPGFGGGPSFEAVSDDAIDPRLGFVWDVTGDARWVAKAHWGRYHQSLFALLFDRAEGGNVFQDLEFWDWIGPGLPDVDRRYTLAEREQFFELFRIRPTGGETGPALDYEQPYVDQLVLSLEHALSDDWKIGLTYVNRENEAIVALVDRNQATNYTRLTDIAVFDFRSGDPILGADGAPLVLDALFLSNDDIRFVGGAPGLSDAQVDALTFDQDFVLTNPDGAFRELDQVQLTLDGRGSSRYGRWSLGASLVYSDLEGNFFSVSGYQDPNGTGVGQFVNPNEAINSGGTLRNSSEWEVKLRLSGDLPWKLSGGLYVNYISGDAFTPTYTIDDRQHDFVTADGAFLDPDLLLGVGGETIFLEPRGTREFEDFTVIDLHLDRVIDLGALDLTLGFDVFNLTNEDVVRALKTSVNDQVAGDPTTLFGSTRRRLDPRAFRLYASLRW